MRKFLSVVGFLFLVRETWARAHVREKANEREWMKVQGMREDKVISEKVQRGWNPDQGKMNFYKTGEVCLPFTEELHSIIERVLNRESD